MMRQLGWLGASLIAGLVLWGCNSSNSSNEEIDCEAGSESCVCGSQDSCDDGLVCASNRCVDPAVLTAASTMPGSGGAGGSGAVTGGSGAGSDASGGTNPSSGSNTSGGAPGTGGVGGQPSTTGTAGVFNRGGAGGAPPITTSTTAAGGTGSVTPALMFGASCESDDDCDTDLICVAADSNALLSGGPAGGLCTQPCTDDCGPGAVCLGFGSDSYCMPLCGLGDGQVDCLARPDMVCDLLPAPVGSPCAVDDDCDTNQVCLSGQCVVGLPVCLPKCGADVDCPDGRFCDPRTGECIDDAPTGKLLGDVCDVTLDECRGFCGESGHCIETCSLGSYPSCGSSSLSAGTAECLAPLYPVGPDPGDLGACFGLCDCTSDCVGDLSCISFATIDLDPPELRGRAGFCDREVSGDVVLSCSD